MAIQNGVTAAELMQMGFGSRTFIAQSSLTGGLKLLGARKAEGKFFMAPDDRGRPKFGIVGAIPGSHR